MNISYVENINTKVKLFSFNRHDYKEYGEKENYMMIDGGFDYSRYSVDNINTFLRESKIEDVFSDIRNQFKWGRNYTKDMVKLEKTEYILLKDLERDHIYAILKYFTEPLVDKSNTLDKTWGCIHMLFIQELIYRYECR